MNPAKGKNTVLWWALIGFGLLLASWTTLFVIASHHRVPEVPLATNAAARSH